MRHAWYHRPVNLVGVIAALNAVHAITIGAQPLHLCCVVNAILLAIMTPYIAYRTNRHPL